MIPDEIWNALSDLANPQSDRHESALQSLRDADSQAIEPLRFLLQTGEASARQVAAHALGYFTAPDAVTALIEALHDASPEVSAAASKSLTQIGEPAVDQLLRAGSRQAWTGGSLYLRELNDMQTGRTCFSSHRGKIERNTR